jgi:DNA repair protein RecN (Recombination protein N)
MLRRLHIRQFVLVDELELEFGPGFTALTGETGAGKSILIDALKLALGERGDASVLLPGAARAEISAEFDTPAGLAQWLEQQGFEPGETVLLRRVIDAQGRSRGFLNGSPATLAQLRQAGDALVDIHGQHAWQSLARSDAARDLLDAHAGAAAERQACELAWRAWRDADERLRAARADAGQMQREREGLRIELAELERLAPQPDEWEPLNAEHRRLAHAAELIEQLQAAGAWLDDDETGAVRLLARAQQALQAAAGIDAALQPLVDQLEQLRTVGAELGHEVAARLRQADVDPQRLADVDARLSAWMSQARRHRVAADELPAHWQGLRARMEQLELGADLDALAAAERAAHALLRDAAAALSRLRADAAGRLAGGVRQLMQELGMKGGNFDVALNALPQIQAGGAEAVELLVAGHAGAQLRPLARVASGGELSRIALALAATTASQQPVATLMFDEVDAGIGGAVAHTVGRLLGALGADRQVLAVTHLAQVAACAAHHLQVDKTTRDGRTFSSVRPLDEPARTLEIARMLGGDASSDVALAHAREMLAAAPPSAQGAAQGAAGARARRGRRAG